MEHRIERINWRMMEFYSGEDSRRIVHTRLPAAKSGAEPQRGFGTTRRMIRSTGRRNANCSACCS